MITLAVKLLIAHVIGDFVFQPDKWIEDKKQRKQRSPYLYLHIGIHTLSLLVLLKFEWNYWPLILTIIVSHFIIDLLKLKVEGKLNARLLFGLDQAAHLAVIGLLVFIYAPFQIDVEILYSFDSLILILALIGIWILRTRLSSMEKPAGY